MKNRRFQHRLIELIVNVRDHLVDEAPVCATYRHLMKWHTSSLTYYADSTSALNSPAKSGEPKPNAFNKPNSPCGQPARPGYNINALAIAVVPTHQLSDLSNTFGPGQNWLTE